MTYVFFAQFEEGLWSNSESVGDCKVNRRSRDSDTLAYDSFPEEHWLRIQTKKHLEGNPAAHEGRALVPGRPTVSQLGSYKVETRGGQRRATKRHLTMELLRNDHSEPSIGLSPRREPLSQNANVRKFWTVPESDYISHVGHWLSDRPCMIGFALRMPPRHVAEHARHYNRLATRR